MAVIRSPLSTGAQKITISTLQKTLVDLVDLSLTAKQAHWNVVGPHFRSIHLQLDELVAVARKYTDLVAERAVALGGNPDGRAETVVADRSSKPLQAGYLRDLDGVHKIIEYLGPVVEEIRQGMLRTAEPDPPTQDLLNELLHDLEEQFWMFQAIAA